MNDIEPVTICQHRHWNHLYRDTLAHAQTTGDRIEPFEDRENRLVGFKAAKASKGWAIRIIDLVFSRMETPAGHPTLLQSAEGRLALAERLNQGVW